MKYSAAYLLTLALGAQVQCQWAGERVIGPNYVATCHPDIIRMGIPFGMEENVHSATRCAELCMKAGRSVCTWSPRDEQCMVGEDCGVDFHLPGVLQLRKVGPGAYNPFRGGPNPMNPPREPGNPAMLVRQNVEAHQAGINPQPEQPEQPEQPAGPGGPGGAEEPENEMLNDLIDMFAANCPSRHGQDSMVGGTEYTLWCGHAYDPKHTPRDTDENVGTLVACIKRCSKEPWCTYALHGISQTTCQLYDSDLSRTPSPTKLSWKWNCAVKNSVAAPAA